MEYNDCRRNVTQALNSEHTFHSMKNVKQCANDISKILIISSEGTETRFISYRRFSCFFFFLLFFIFLSHVPHNDNEIHIYILCCALCAAGAAALASLG